MFLYFQLTSLQSGSPLSQSIGTCCCMGKAIIIDQGDETEGLEREGLDGGGIGEGQFEETNPCLNLTHESLDSQCHLQLHY